jgi:hypothetical protein
MTEPDALNRLSRVANQPEQPAPEFSDRLLNELLSELTADQTGPTGSSFDHHTTNETAMEVIMLSPDRNEPPTTRRWLMVAAAIAVLALVGGLIFAGTRADEDLVPADQPVPTVPADPVDEADPEVSTPLEPDADATRPTSGTISGGLECSHGLRFEDVDLNRSVIAQSCLPDPDNAGGPFPNEFVVSATIIELTDPGLPVDVPATQFLRITTTGDISAGLTTTSDDGGPATARRHDNTSAGISSLRP